MDTGYLSQQVTTIIGQLHSLFDEIGVPHSERDARESELFSSLSETLHNHLRLVSSEKNNLIEEAKHVLATTQQLEASLDGGQSNNQTPNFDYTSQITFPLIDCLRALKEKQRSVSRLHQERFEQVKKLAEALESYSSHLEPSFIQIQLPPTGAGEAISPTFNVSPAFITSLDAEFTRVYEEYERRVMVVQKTAQEMVKLWAELGTPQAQTDSTIVENWRDAPEQLGLHQNDLNNLLARRDKLLEEKRLREKRLKDLKLIVEGLWARLGVEEHERKAFQAGNRGCALRAINDLEDELARLNELKRQNLHLFVEDARNKLHILWDELYFSEEEAVEFTPMFCDVYSDALLSAHESEIARLETLKEQRAATLQLIAKHRSLIKDREELVASSQDASRLMLKPQKGEKRDPTRLLREEKMRKRIAKDLPRIEQELGQVLESWEDEYGRPFMVFGERYLDTIADASTKGPPPRSKTPNGLPPRSKTPNGLPPRSKTPVAPSTQPKAAKPIQSVQRVVTARELPTTRPKTPGVYASGTTMNVSKIATGSKSPSRLPSRVPLSSMPHGNNSPERQQRLEGTLRKNNGQLMAPPPKLRDLYQAPVTATPSSVSSTDFSRSGSVVRHVQPEDPYNDSRQAQDSYSNSSVLRAYDRAQNNIRSMPPPPRPNYSQERYETSDTVSVASARSRPISSTAASSVAARQISNTSSNVTHDTVYSGSENWETYEDDESIALEVHAPPLRHRQFRDVPEPVPDNYRSDVRGINAKRAADNDHYDENTVSTNGAYISRIQPPPAQLARTGNPTGFTGVMGRVQQRMQPPTRYLTAAGPPADDDETY